MNKLVLNMLVVICSLSIISCKDEQTLEELKEKVNQLELQQLNTKPIKIIKKDVVYYKNFNYKYTFYVVQIENHDYLIYSENHKFGLTHYPDCRYCLKQKGEKK